jgi:hypothetical protein
VKKNNHLQGTSYNVNTVSDYLNQCGVLALVERENVHTPPTAGEVKALIAYLRAKGIKPVIVGSVAVFHHLKTDTKKFRPTVDLDIFVDKKLPLPPSGWKRDPASPGLESWISPSGGYVDFMQKGHEFPSGERNPDSVETHLDSPQDYPVAAPIEMLKMKLNSMREKDLADAMALVRALGSVPDLKGLNQTQRENLGLVKQWFRLRPQAAYGE